MVASFRRNNDRIDESTGEQQKHEVISFHNSTTNGVDEVDNTDTHTP